MSESKVITIRLPNDLLDNIDELVKEKFDNRSEAMRSLLELGIDRNSVVARIEDIERKLDRLMIVCEAQFQQSHISNMLILNSIDKNKKLELLSGMYEIQQNAKASLARLLLDKFGE